MGKTLDEMLDGKAEVPATPTEKPEQETEVKPTEVEAKPEGEAKTERPRDETGKFAKGEKQSESPSEKPSKREPDDPETGLKAGITAERKKRQAVETRLRELEGQLQKMQQPAQVPDVVGDPQGYAQHVRSEVETAMLDERVNLSVDFARDRHNDFNEVMGEGMELWTEALAADPTLYQRAIGQRNPGEWAYQHLKREKTFSEIGDPENWKKAQLEALRKELEPTIRKEFEAKLPNHVVPPPSLASVASGGRIESNSQGVERKPFDKIFPLN